MSTMRGSREEMHRLLLDFASTQLSPKLSVLAIPEWRVMETSARRVLEAAEKLTGTTDHASVTLDDLRKQGRASGHRFQNHNVDRAQLIGFVRAGPSTIVRKTTHDQLRKQVRAKGGNPQPEPRRATTNWDAEECRRFLLKRKPAAAIASLYAECLPGQAKRSKSCSIDHLIEETNVC